MKRILFTQRVEVIESYNERRDCADQRIAQFLRTCGYLPIPVPNVPEVACSIADDLSPKAIVFSGGNNLVNYNGDAPERDQTERKLLSYAIDHDIPLYGFCRGMQMILDFWGAKLSPVEGHVAKLHEITGSFGSRIVNSYHSLACKNTDKKDIKILARSGDDVIEAVSINGKKVLGTMWHPERKDSFEKRDINMLKSFIEEGKIVL